MLLDCKLKPDIKPKVNFITKKIQNFYTAKTETKPLSPSHSLSIYLVTRVKMKFLENSGNQSLQAQCALSYKNHICFAKIIVLHIQKESVDIMEGLSGIFFTNCSTPNPYHSPIRQVGVSIIIVKIYSTTLSLYYSPIKHLCRKNSIAEPPFEILTSNFLGYAHIALT